MTQLHEYQDRQVLSPGLTWALSQLDVAALLVTARLEIVWSNRHAKASLDSSAGIRRENERLIADTEIGSAKLTDAVRKARSSAQTLSLACHKSRDLVLTVAAIPSEVLSPVAKRDEENALYLVVSSGQLDPSSSAFRTYCGQYQLTVAESQILYGLLDGLAPCKIALHRRVSEATVRSQIKSILGKTAAQSIRSLTVEFFRKSPFNFDPESFG